MAHDHGMMGSTTPQPNLMDDHNHGDMTGSTSDPSHGNMNMIHMMQSFQSISRAEQAPKKGTADKKNTLVIGRDEPQMWFYASEGATILFEPWTTDSWQEMLGSCIGIFVIAMLYEGLKAGRLWLTVYSNTRNSTVTIYNNGTHMESPEARADGSDQGSEANLKNNQHGSIKSQSLSLGSRNNNLAFHILQTILHIIQIGIGYMLMLITMTFNAYLFISVVLGCGAGYLVFCYKRPIILDGNECCH